MAKLIGLPSQLDAPVDEAQTREFVSGKVVAPPLAGVTPIQKKLRHLRVVHAPVSIGRLLTAHKS